MELQPVSWLMVSLLLAGGVLVGLLTGYILFSGNRRVKTLEEELDEAKKQHGAYREEVARHFAKTAGLVNNMTQSYAAVYNHIAGGAEQLCGDLASEPSLEFTESKLLESDQGDKTADTTSTPVEVPNDISAKVKHQTDSASAGLRTEDSDPPADYPRTGYDKPGHLGSEARKRGLS